jgi:hypothetical protein
MTVAEAPLKGQQAPQTPPTSSGSTKRKIWYGILAAVVVAIVVAVPVTVTQFSVHSRSTRGTSPVGTSSGTSVLTQSYCSKLRGSSQTYCNAYLKSKGPNKFMAASIWLQASQATRKYGSLAHLNPLLHICTQLDE